MKKLGVFVFLSLLLVSSFFPFVSAQEILQPIANSVESFYNTVLAPFAKFLLGNNTQNAEIFFAKLLLFVLIASLVWYAADKFPVTHGNRAIIVSAIISILSVRYISVAWIETIVLPYTALGITISAIIPLVLFFFFIETGLAGQPVLRKICWIFAAFIFIALFFFRYDEPAFVNNEGFTPGWIYFFSAVACVTVLGFDRTIQRAFTKAQYSNINEVRMIKVRAELVDEYNKTRKGLADGALSEKDAKALITEIRKRAKANGVEEGIFELPG